MRISSCGRVLSSVACSVAAIVLVLLIGSLDVGAQRRARPPAVTAAPPPPPAALPKVAVVGIRVVGGGLGANGSELRAFNERPGTAIALAIQAPAGTGIVEIDDHGSKLDAFSDDQGQSLLEEGRIGPFPKLADDHSVALVEVEVQARPSAKAVSVTAQGSLAMTLAGGSKPQRLPGVRLEVNRTMKLGAATITITAATADEESTKLTFGLPRSVVTTIRATRFLDAKNAPIESRRTSSGYFNDKAELEFDVKTKDKIVTVEFDVWQNLRAIKVPFNIEAGLGVAPGGRSSASDAPRGGKDEARASVAVNRPPPVIGPTDGATSVDAVVKQMQAAATTGKAGQLLTVIYPDDRPEFGRVVAVMLAFQPLAHLDDAKAGEKIQKDLDALFAKHQIKPPLSRDPDDLFKNVDLTAFLTDAIAFLKSQAKKGDTAELLPVPKGRPQNVTITGDTAVAKLQDAEVKFTKVSDRWFIRLQ